MKYVEKYNLLERSGAIFRFIIACENLILSISYERLKPFPDDIEEMSCSAMIFRKHHVAGFGEMQKEVLYLQTC